MFYTFDQSTQELKYNPLKACVVPRPIGWVSTVSANNVVNIAPFSYFNLVAEYPAMLMFSCVNKPHSIEEKDTLKNIRATKQLVVNIATIKLADQMNLTSTPLAYEVSEAEFAKLEMVPSRIVTPPRIALSPIALECELYQIVALPAHEPVNSNNLILAKVLGIYINDSYICEGKIDIAKIQPICRLGYNDYAVIEKTFTLVRPKI